MGLWMFWIYKSVILEPTAWFCSVTISGGVVLRTLDLKDAQSALGIGSRSSPQAIIPMTGAKAGDPTTLSKTWSGGSMWWFDYNHIHAMQDSCVRTGAFVGGNDLKYLSAIHWQQTKSMSFETLCIFSLTLSLKKSHCKGLKMLKFHSKGWNLFSC